MGTSKSKSPKWRPDFERITIKEAAVTATPGQISTTLGPTSSSVPTSTKEELTNVHPKTTNTNHAHDFVPKVCEVNDVDNSSRNLQWLPSSPVLISQENTPVDLQCDFCLKKPMLWTKIVWYRDNKPITSNKVSTAGTLHITHPQNSADEGEYTCTVVTPNNQTASQTMVLIINKDSGFSTIPSMLVRNETSHSTYISWLVRGPGIFDSVKVIVKIRRLDSPIWEYKRYYAQYISGSTELQDLIPGTQYLVNITALNSDGEKEECRCVTFWTNAWNSTDYGGSFLGMDLSTRRVLGLVVGSLSLLFTFAAIYCCIVHPACDEHSHEGYELSDDDPQDFKCQDKNCGFSNHCQDSGSIYSKTSQQHL